MSDGEKPPRKLRVLPKLPEPKDVWTQRLRERTLNMLPRLSGTVEAPDGLSSRLQYQEAWALVYAEELAAQFGGRIGAHALSCIRGAAHAHAWSEELYRQGAMMLSRDLAKDGVASERTTKVVEIASRLRAAGDRSASEALTVAQAQCATSPAPTTDALDAFITDGTPLPASEPSTSETTPSTTGEPVVPEK